MKTVKFGQTDLRVTRYCQGTAFRHLPRNASDPMAERVLNHCLDRGVNFFDSAYAYGWGGAEEMLGKVVEGRRDKVVICTKVPASHPPPEEGKPGDPATFTEPYLTEQVEAALARLRTNYIDLYLLHQPDKATPEEEVCASMDGLVRSGKIRYWGLSNHPATQVASFVDAAKAAGTTPPSALEEYYNIAGCYSDFPEGQSRIRWLEHEMFPVVRRYRLGTLFFSPVDVAYLAASHQADPGTPLESLHREIDAVAEQLDVTRPQVCIAWVLHHSEATSVLSGAESTEHVDEMLGGLNVELTDNVRSRLDEASFAYSKAMEATHTVDA